MKVINLTYKETNCYLILTQDGWLMVDAGWPDTFSQVLQLLSRQHIPVNEINYLVITHFHPDHAGLVQNLKDLGINLILHEDQVPYVKELNSFYKKNPKANFKDITGSNTTIVTTSESRELLLKLGIEGELLCTPGHTIDSISLIIDNSCAFIGDLPALSLAEAKDNPMIRDSWALIQDFGVKKIYPGHGEAYNISL